MADEVTVANGLFELYAKQQSEISGYYHDAQVILERLRLDLCAVLGLPETYRSLNGNREEPWLVLYKWDPESGTVERARSCFDVDTMSPEGELNAAIGVAISHQIDSHPKSIYWLPLKIQLTRDKTFVALCTEPSEVFTYDRDALEFSDFSRAFIQRLEASLRASVYDHTSRVFAGQRGIGFLANAG